jgi:hypothetical protein
MPISHHAELPNTSVETYDKVNERIDFDGDPPSGLIFHSASAREGGGFRVFEVWESREDFDTFEQERLMPAVREVFGEDPGEPPVREVVEIHHYLAP